VVQNLRPWILYSGQVNQSPLILRAIRPSESSKNRKIRNQIFKTMSSTPTKAEKENERLKVIIGQLLNHCDKEGGECSYCSQLICPHKDMMHFHHDGCPSCTLAEEEEFSKVCDPYMEMWELSQNHIKHLEQRLRIAEDFIRRKHYLYFGGYCISCGSKQGDPCNPDCELQKILGNEKGKE
jgi:hypothetical protein